jgi:SPP1 gp7 family putative phage head morphogenesis protein
MFRAVSTLTDQLSALSTYEGVFTVRSLAACARGVKIRSAAAKELYKTALARPIPATGELLEAFVQDWSKKQIAQVNGVIGKGYTSGWTNQQMVQLLRGTKAKNYQDGIVQNIGRNAEAVVRTSVQHVANTARMEVWAKNSDIVKAVRVVATLDGHTTPQCRSLDGREFPLAEAPRFPIHVRCRTTTVAVIDDAFAFLDEGATRSSETGYVDANQTYYEWLKEQPSEFQKDAIGATRAKLLRDGGLTAEEFARLNLNRRFEPMTLDEMRKAEPKAFERAGL